MLDNNIHKNQQLQPFAALTAPYGTEQQVSMQAVNPELLKENIQDSYVANRVAETTDDLKGMLCTLGIAIPAWFTIAQGMDYYAKKSRGDFENTVHYKVGQFGDNITKSVSDSKFGKSSFGQAINKGVKSFKTFVKDKIVGKSRVLTSFAYTPSKPELDMVKGQANGMCGVQLFDYPQHSEKFVESLKYAEDLDCYGATKEEISRYVKAWNNAATPQAKAKVLQMSELETILNHSRQKRTPAQIAQEISNFKKMDAAKQAVKLKDLKAFEWGYNDFAELEAVQKNIQEKMPRVLEACHDANRNMFARIWGTNHNKLGRFKKFLFGREVFASETANKLAGSLGNFNKAENPELVNVLKKTGLDKKIPKSILGKFIAKYNNLVLEGATNRVAGGKLVAIMQAAYLADVIYKASKAEGAGEKMKSFAERFAEMIAFFVCMPLSIQLMHKIGGLQYAGMDKKAVEAYRQALNAHNDKAMSGGFRNKAEWKESYKKLKEMRKAGVKNPITNLFKRIGRIVTVGLEQIRPFDAKDIGEIAADGTKTYRKGIGSKLKDLFRHPKFGIKQMSGYPMRIIVGMMMILPFMSKIAVKGSHLVFGKPKNSVLDEGKENQPEEGSSNPNAVQIPAQLQTQPQMTQETIQQVQPTTPQQSPTNLLNQYKNGYNGISQEVQNVMDKVTTNTNTTTASAPDNNVPVRTYIPSPAGVQVKSDEDNSAADAALRRADLAEKQALQILNMN